MNKKVERDFRDFSHSKTHVSKSMDKWILNHTHKDLNPSRSIVILKLLAIQGFIGTITLLFCPQFDFSLTSNEKVYHFFHHYFGIYGCALVCGALFMGSGAWLAGFLLRFSELELILASQYLLNFFLSGLAIVMFLILGAEIPLELAVAWMMGGILSSALAISTGKKMRVLGLKRKRMPHLTC